MPKRVVVVRTLLALLAIGVIGSIVAANWFDVDVSGGLLRAIDFAFWWVLVPALLISQFLYAASLVRIPVSTDNEMGSKFMGLMLGLAIFVIVIVLNRQSEMFTPGASVEAFESPWRYALLGGLAGVALMVFMETALASRAISIFIAILSSASLSALYFYLFIEQLRDPILLVSLSMLVGVFAYGTVAGSIAFRVPSYKR